MANSKRSTNTSPFELSADDLKDVKAKGNASHYEISPDDISQYRKEKYKNGNTEEDKSSSSAIPTPEKLVAPGTSPDGLLEQGLSGNGKPTPTEQQTNTVKSPESEPFSKAPGITPEKLFDNGIKGLGAVKEHDIKTDSTKTFLENDLTMAMAKDQRIAETTSSFFGVQDPAIKEMQDKQSGLLPKVNKPVADSYDSMLAFKNKRLPDLEEELKISQNEDQQRSKNASAIIGSPMYASNSVVADSPETIAKKEYISKFKASIKDASVPLIIDKQFKGQPVSLDSDSIEQMGEKARRIAGDNLLEDDMGIINNPDALKSSLSRQTREVKKANNWAEGRDILAKHYSNELAEKAKLVEPLKMNRVLSIIQKPEYTEADQNEMKVLMEDPSVVLWMNDLKKANDTQTSLEKSFKTDYPQVARNNMRIAALNAMDKLNKSQNATLDKAGSSVGGNKYLRNTIQALLGVSPDEHDYPAIAKELGISIEDVKSIANESYGMGMGLDSGTANGMRLRGFTQSIVSGIDQITAGTIQGVNRIFTSKTTADLRNANIDLRTEQYSEVPDSYKFTKKDGSLNLNLNSVINTMGETTGQLAAFVAPNLIGAGVLAPFEGSAIAKVAAGAAADIAGAAKKTEEIAKAFEVINHGIDFAMTTSTGTLSSYEQAYQEAAKYTTDQSKRHGYATAISLVTGLSENILSPTQMVGKLQSGLTRPSFKTFERELKKEGLTKTLLRTITSGMKEGGMVIGDEVLEEIVPIFVDPAARKGIIGKERNPGEAGNEFIQTVAQTAIGTALLGAGASITAMRDHARVQREGIFEAGMEHEKYVDYFRNQAATGKMSEEDANKHVQATMLAALVVATLPQTGKDQKKLTHNQKVDLAATQFRYLHNEQLKKEATFIAEKEQYDANAKQALDDQKRILDGESLDPTPQSQKQVASIANKIEAAAQGKPQLLSPNELKKIEENPEEIQAAGIDIFDSLFGELSNKVEPESVPDKPTVVYNGEEWKIDEDLGDGRVVVTKDNGSKITINRSELYKKDPKDPKEPPPPPPAVAIEAPKEEIPVTNVIDVTPSQIPAPSIVPVVIPTPAPIANNSKEETVKEQVDTQIDELQKKIDAEPDPKEKAALQNMMDAAKGNYALLMGDVQNFPEIDEKESIKLIQPIADKMASIERELGNNGFSIDIDYDHEITVTNDKTGELVDDGELPKTLIPLAAAYEEQAKKLLDFNEKATIIALDNARNIEEAPSEVVEPEKKAIPEKVEAPKKEEAPEPKPEKSGPKEIDVQVEGFHGKPLKGIPITITGFPMDAVVTQIGLDTQIRELSSGNILGQGMGREEALADMKEQFKGRNVNKIKEALFNSYDLMIGHYTNAQKQLNPSPAYDRWLKEKKYKEDKAPFLYTDEQRNRLSKLIEGYNNLNDGKYYGQKVFEQQINRKNVTGKEKGMTDDSIKWNENRLKEIQDGTYEESKPSIPKISTDEIDSNKKLTVEQKRKRSITKTNNLYNKQLAELKKIKAHDLFLPDLIQQLELERQERIEVLNKRYDDLALSNPEEVKPSVPDEEPKIIDQLYNELLDIDKPVLSLDFVPNEDIKAKSNDAKSDIEQQDIMKEQHELMQDILGCLWS